MGDLEIRIMFRAAVKIGDASLQAVQGVMGLEKDEHGVTDYVEATMDAYDFDSWLVDELAYRYDIAIKDPYERVQKACESVVGSIVEEIVHEQIDAEDEEEDDGYDEEDEDEEFNPCETCLEKDTCIHKIQRTHQH